jgi:hypothetical protein
LHASHIHKNNIGVGEIAFVKAGTFYFHPIMDFIAICLDASKNAMDWANFKTHRLNSKLASCKEEHTPISRAKII